MIKFFLFVLFLITSILFADNNYETALYEKIFPLLMDKKIIKIYTRDKNKPVFKKSKDMVLVNDCINADIVFGAFYDAKCAKKPHFATTYKDFIKDKSAIGAFYWKKGRPQLRFSRKAFEKFHLILPKILEKYAQ